MKSYIRYRNQIQGIKDVSETVKTVEKIAASSVHFLKQEVSSLNIYAAETERMLARLSLFYQKKDHPLLQKKETGKETLVILTGDKGLVGDLWHGIINTFLENAKQYQIVIVIGAKGESYLEEEDIPTIKSFTNFFDIPQKEEIEHITNYIFDEFKKKTFSQVDILYPKFISLAEQTPNFIRFLPFEFTPLEIAGANTKHKENKSLMGFTPLEIVNYDGKNVTENKKHEQRKFLTGFKLTKEEKSGDGLPIFEPSKQKIFDELLHKYIEIFFLKIIMETKLSELSARTVAMEHTATKTKELVRKLAVNYAKERRQIVTQRQIESFAARQII